MEIREAMKKQIAPLPAPEMCIYKQIKEDIIKERNEAMAQSKLFEITLKKVVNEEEIAAQNTKKKQKARQAKSIITLVQTEKLNKFF